MTDATLLKVAEQLLKARDIVILPHLNADGDFLPGVTLIKEHLQKQYDVALNIDNGDIGRLGTREHYYHHARIKLSIDHHTTNSVAGDYTYVDTNASATGEIIYDFILNYLKGSLNKDMALCLYTAIVTDTGGFRYTNTTPRTLEIGAELLRFGIDFYYVNKKVFDIISKTKLALIKQTVNSMRVLEDGKFAVSYLTYEDLHNLFAKGDDFEGLVNYGRNLEGVEVSAFLREEPKGHFKASLRSNDYVDVACIAARFNGGGHIRAAGFNIDGELEEVILSITAAVLPEIRREG